MKLPEIFISKTINSMLNRAFSLLFLFISMGCGYLHLDMVDLKHQDNQSSAPVPVPIPVTPQTPPTPSKIDVILTSETVQKNSGDTLYENFLTLRLDAPADSELTVELSAFSTEATASDYALGATQLTFAKGESEKIIPITVRGYTGPADFDKDVYVLISPVSNLAIPPQTVKFTITDPQPLQLTVPPLYPVNGADWNSYVRSSGDSLKYASRYLKIDLSEFPTSDEPCPANIDLNPCLHGGELRQVIVSNKKSCANLRLADSEEAFTWRCSETSKPIRFIVWDLTKAKA